MTPEEGERWFQFAFMKQQEEFMKQQEELLKQQGKNMALEVQLAQLQANSKSAMNPSKRFKNISTIPHAPLPKRCRWCQKFTKAAAASKCSDKKCKSHEK